MLCVTPYLTSTPTSPRRSESSDEATARVLFTLDVAAVLVAETAGRAERVIEILRDYGVVAVDISRAEVTSGSALLVTGRRAGTGIRPQDPFIRVAVSAQGTGSKIEVEEGRQYTFIEDFLAKAKFEGARIATIDGLRADWPDGWGLVRASNTTPVLVLRFDAKDEEALERIKSAFREQLLATDPSLKLPF